MWEIGREISISGKVKKIELTADEIIYYLENGYKLVVPDGDKNGM